MNIYRAGVSIILIVLFAMSCDKGFIKSNKVGKDAVLQTMDTSVTIIEEEVDTVAEIETIIQETEPIVEPLEAQTASEGYGNDRFYMVVGSFLSETLAQKYAQKMLDKGYQPQVIFSNTMGFYRVSAQSYEDYTLAVNDIQNFRNNVTPRAWVHVKK